MNFKSVVDLSAIFSKFYINLAQFFSSVNFGYTLIFYLNKTYTLKIINEKKMDKYSKNMNVRKKT